MSHESDRSDAAGKRAGLSVSEAAIAWAFARFGGDIEACSVLEGDAAKAVRQAAELTLEASDQHKARVVEAWRREDRRWGSLEQISRRFDPGEIAAHAEHLSGRWRDTLVRITRPSRSGGNTSTPPPWHDNSVRTRRAIVRLVVGELRSNFTVRRTELDAESGFGLEQLIDIGSGDRERWIRQLGVFQLVELARNQDRRSLARLRRALQTEDRDWFDACIKHKRHIDRLERGRLRELFLSISRQEPDLTVRLLHLGLYSIAASAGVRFSAKLKGIARQLPRTLKTLLLHYHRLDQRSAPTSLATSLRRSLDGYVERRILHAEDIHE